MPGIVDKYSKKATLCWKCKNACKGCCWSKNFQPVEGWEATPTRIKQFEGSYIDSYCVHSCPEFEKDDNNFNFITKQDLASMLNVSKRNLIRMGRTELNYRCKEIGYQITTEFKKGSKYFYVKPISYGELKVVPLELIKMFWKTTGYTQF